MRAMKSRVTCCQKLLELAWSQSSNRSCFICTLQATVHRPMFKNYPHQFPQRKMSITYATGRGSSKASKEQLSECLHNTPSIRNPIPQITVRDNSQSYPRPQSFQRRTLPAPKSTSNMWMNNHWEEDQITTVGCQAKKMMIRK